MHRIVPLVLVLILAPAGASGDTVAAEWELDSSGNSYGSFGGASVVTARGQAFLAEAGGTVRSVALRVGRASNHAIGLRVSIQAADSTGLPTGAPLVTEDFSAALIPADSSSPPVTFVFASSAASLVAGTRYVLAAEAAEGSPESSLFFLNGESSASATYASGAACYSTGQNWVSSEQTDWAFRVLVDESTPVRTMSWGSLKTAATGH